MSTPNAPLPIDAQRRIAEACGRFDGGWPAGKRPRIEDFLPADGSADERRELLRALLEVELHYRRRAGEAFEPGEYLARFPGQSGLVQEVFSAGQLSAGRAGSCPAQAAPPGPTEPNATADADRNLLFAVLALQADLIDRDRFVRACTLWASGKDTPLAAMLVEQGWLRAEDRAGVERLLERKLERHGGAARAGLAEAAGPAERAALATVADPVVERSLALLSTAEGLAAGDAPDRAGRNLLFEEIGRGGMGRVLRGHDPNLRRDLAVKLLHPEYGREPEVQRRFVEEAQIAGQLQHPGIVPVYEIGRCDDGRPFFTMKLIKGSTLASLLAQRASPADDLPRLLGVFAAVCQAVAYAHSRRVIHRDLKPANVMVGAFGEVQVMDWGLAKVLGRPDPDGTDGATETVVRTVRTGPSESAGHGRGRTGVAGTPAYMAPEQARADEDATDERADVFGLGGILCVILTGQPPHAGVGRDEALRRAATGDLAGALARLSGCAAEAELVSLAHACLAARPEDRPRHAGEVAGRLSAYLAGVQERLRQAGLERATASARAEEAAKKAAAELRAAESERAAAQARADQAAAQVRAERRARRLLGGLAGAVLLFVLAAGAGAWVVQQQREATRRRQVQTDAAVRDLCQRGRTLLEAAWEAHDPARLAGARAEADRAVAVARTGEASAPVAEEAAAFQNETRERAARATKTRALLDALADVLAPKESTAYKDDGSGRMLAVAEPSADEQYVAAFRRWGLDVDGTPEAEVVARLRAAPAVVREEIIGALDSWVVERRREKRPRPDLLRLTRVAGMLDGSDKRQRLRVLLAEETLPPPQAVARLTAALGGAAQPWAALAQLERAKQEVLGELRGGPTSAAEPVPTVVLLARFRAAHGDVTGAVALLRQALVARPNRVVLLDTLGKLLGEREPARLGEAIERFQAARAVRPQLGIALSRALCEADRAGEAEEVMRDLARRRSDHPETHFALGNALAKQNKFALAEAAYRKAASLKPNYAEAHNNRGNVLHGRGKLDEAEAAYRKAISLRPDFALAYYNLGVVLDERGKLDKAEAAFQKTVSLDPHLAEAWSNLGNVLWKRGKLVEAEAACRKAISLKANYAAAHNNLGNVLRERGSLARAEEACRKAISLDPNFATAYVNLGAVLQSQRRWVEAEAAHRKAIALESDCAHAYSNLGDLLRQQGRLAQAEEACRKAIFFDPDFAAAHCNLGNVLLEQQRWDPAEAAYGRAIALRPAFAEAHCNLGFLLRLQRKWVRAEKAYLRAIHYKKDFGAAHLGLGWVLLLQDKLPGAEEHLRRAVGLVPLDADAHKGLGVVLRRLARLEPAEKYFRQAVSLAPQDADAHHYLGWVLYLRNQLPGAEKHFRRAVALAPGSAQSHNDLGEFLRRQGKLAEAEKHYRLALKITPRHPNAQGKLARVLEEQGKWAALEAHYRRVLASAPGDTRIQTRLAYAKRLAGLDDKLPAFLKGDYRPRNNDERLGLIYLCKSRRLYHAAARLSADTLAGDAKLADDLASGHRYNAACYAALAAAGTGKDAGLLSLAGRSLLRRRALVWLRADLDAYRALLKTPPGRLFAQKRLADWQADTDFASVRGKDALEKLTADEREHWQQLWADVEALRKKARAAE